MASAPRAFEAVVAVLLLLLSAPRAFEAVIAVPALSQSAPRAFDDLLLRKFRTKHVEATPRDTTRLSRRV